MTHRSAPASDLTAAQIIHDLITEIRHHFPGKLFRHNVGAAVGENRFIQFGIAGQSDVSGIVTVHGRYGVRVEIEVKAPGDTVKPAQLRWLNMINRHGGIGFVARDVDGAFAELRRRIDEYSK
jgi:hypothetical protein